MKAEELIEKYQKDFDEKGIVYDLAKLMKEFAKHHTELGMREMAKISSPFGNQGLSKAEKELLNTTLNNIK